MTGIDTAGVPKPPNRFYEVTVDGRTYHGAVAQAVCEAIEQRDAAEARVAELEAENEQLRALVGCEFAATHGVHVDMIGNGQATCCGPVQAPMPEPHDPETTEDQG